MIRAIAVIVPVHDEEELLGAALDAVAVAVDRVAARVRTGVWVVLDDCSDGSRSIAADRGAHLVTVSERCVGRARAAGAAEALATFSGLAPSRIWTAHTDGDSIVPPHWLATQIDMADAGADVVLGTVRPDFRDLTDHQARAWWSTRTPGVPVGVHGANLGIRADALHAAGGFPPLTAHEDTRLVGRLYETGAVVTATDDIWVRTSGRPHGRAPDGFARYLRERLLAPTAREVDELPR